MRAECERGLGHGGRALELYEGLGREFGGSREAMWALMRRAEMAREGGEMGKAAALFEEAAGHAAGGERRGEAWEGAAACHLAAGDARAALRDWGKRLAMKPEGDELAGVLLQRALVQIELGEAGEAAASLEGAERAGGGEEVRAKVAYWRGVLQAEGKDGEGAVKSFRACLGGGADERTAALARLRLTLVLQGLGRMDEAADEMEPITREKAMVAENPALVEWFIRQRFDQGAYGAVEAAAKTLAGSGASPAWCQIGWFWAGQAAAEMGREGEALAAWGAAVGIPARTREGVEARLLMAKRALGRGDVGEARERYGEAAEAAREDMQDLRARAYFGLGEAAGAGGEWEDAARHYMSVAVLFDDPELTPRALAAAAAAYRELGEEGLRDAAIRELGERYPGSSYARGFEERAP